MTKTQAPLARAGSAGHAPAAYARVIVQALAQSGIDPAPALVHAQITPRQAKSSTGVVNARQLEQLSAFAMQALDDEALGAFERRLPWGSYGMLARASIASPNLGMALRRWCRHHGLLTSRMSLRLSVAGEVASVAIEEHPAHVALPPEAREFSLVFLLRNVHGLSSWFIDSRIPLQEARFPFAAPSHAHAFPGMFSTRLAFDAGAAAIRFDARYLDLPLRRNEASLNQMLQRALPLTVLQYRRDRLLVQQVRQALLTQAPSAHNADELAAALNLSARTLHRQLHEEGASLQQLKDEVRAELARDLLLRTSRPIKQVAAAVGFRHEKSFIRAFRLWTGLPPAAFREAAREAA